MSICDVQIALRSRLCQGALVNHFISRSKYQSRKRIIFGAGETSKSHSETELRNPLPPDSNLGNLT